MRPLPAVGCRLSAVGCPLPAVRYRLSAIRLPPTDIYRQMSHWRRLPRFFASLRMTCPAVRQARNVGSFLWKELRGAVRIGLCEAKASPERACLKPPPQPSGQRPVKPKNPPALGRSILRTFCAPLNPGPFGPAPFGACRHHLPPQAGGQ